MISNKLTQPRLLSRSSHGLNDWIIPIIWGGLLALLLVEMAQSMWWRPVHDTAHLHYVGWLIDQHQFVPYRDVFETSQPLSILFHVLIGRMFGFGDMAFRLVDLALLVALLVVTGQVMRPLGRWPAVVAAVLFGLLYLSFGPSMSLQRDYLALLPVALALLVGGLAWRPARRAFAIGTLFGIAVAIKPHLGLGLPVVLLYSFGETIQQSAGPAGHSTSRWANAARLLLWVGVGVILAFALPLIWLWQSGGLVDWWAIVTRYLPLYIQMNGAHEIQSGLDRWLYQLHSYQSLGGRAALLIPATLGVYLALFESRLQWREKRLVVSLAALVVVYALYAVVAGQFWAYHWMPFFYFATLTGSLVLVDMAPGQNRAGRRWLAKIVFIIGLTLTLRPAPDFFRQLTDQEPRPPKAGRVDEMSAFLRGAVQPGDRVQPLDWVDGGTAQAMHLAGAIPATPYLYDAQFYHHLSSDYIQELRRNFIERLERSRPRFIIDIPNQSYPTGPDTTDNFPALDRLIRQHYTLVRTGDGYVIYERTR